MIEDLKIQICDLDHQKDLVIYCKTDNIYMCEECFNQNHSGHEMIHLHQFSMEGLLKYREILQITKEKIGKVGEWEQMYVREHDDTVVNFYKNIEEAYDKLFDDIRKHYQKRVINVAKSFKMQELLKHQNKIDESTVYHLKTFEEKLEKRIHTIKAKILQNDFIGIIYLLHQMEINKIKKEADNIYDHILKLQYKRSNDKVATIHYKFDESLIERMIWILDDELTRPTLTYCKPQTNQVFQFDIKHQKSSKSILKNDYVFPINFDTVQVEDSVYITGGLSKQGYFLKNTVHISPETMTVTHRSNMLIEKELHTLTSLSSEILYSIGGQNDSGYLNATERYSIKNDEWKKTPVLAESKRMCSSCSFSKRYIYCIGGYDGSDYVSTIECLDYLDENKGWNKIEFARNEGWTKRRSPGSYQISHNILIIFGGYDGFEKNDAFFFDIEANTIQRSLETLAKKDDFYRKKPKFVDGTLYILGTEFNDIHLFMAAEGNWSLIENTYWITP